MKQDDDWANTLQEKILDSAKYRNTGLHPETVKDLIYQEMQKYSSIRQILKAVRVKLHNIVAPYLGEPNYDVLSEKLDKIIDTSLESHDLQSFCLEVLKQHASTAERIPFMEDFYSQLFTEVGMPSSILDLACGLHPFFFPWMGLPLTTRYYAYDIIQPRIEFINHFFTKIKIEPLAENRDILINPPKFKADLGIFFKEAHRFEKRCRGCNRDFWQNLEVEVLAVSLPTQDLAGTHNLVDYHHKLIKENLETGKPFKEIVFSNEIIYLIEKPGKVD